MAERWDKDEPNSWRGPQRTTMTRLGQLRLSRQGDRLRFMASEAPGQPFIEVCVQEKFGAEVMRRVSFSVSDSHKPGNAVDARLIYLHIIMGANTPKDATAAAPLPEGGAQLPPAPVIVPAQAAGAPAPARGWLVAAILMGIIVVILLAGVVVVVALLMRSRTEEKPAAPIANKKKPAVADARIMRKS
jgi:hypothetical protein